MGDKAREFWDRSPGIALSGAWLQNSQITGTLYKRITGGKRVHWLDWLINDYFGQRSFKRMLSLGCGTGEHEVYVAKQRRSITVDAFDFSDASLKLARERAAKDDLQINFYNDDLNTFTIPPEKRYDLLLCTGSAHHVRELERFFQQLHAASLPDAVLVLNEYVGACYNLYPPAQVKLINRALAALPRPLRLADKFALDSLQKKLESDPSESVRSSLILPIMEQYFTIELRRDYGGMLLHPLYRLLNHAELSKDDPKSTAIVNLLLELEQILMEEGSVPTDFTFCIARPR